MNDIFKDMQAKAGCEYLSDLPSYKRKVWQEMKRLNLADYEERQLEDFSKYVFGMSYQTLKDVMKQQKGREEQCRKHTIHLCEHSNSLCKINNWFFRHYRWWYCRYFYCLFLYHVLCFNA